jgi:hypothetical protein
VLDANTNLALEEGIVLHSLPEQNWYYAFSVITGDQFRLNKTSFWVLENISTGIAWKVLKDNFLKTFEIPLEQAENDLKILLDELFDQKIIRGNGNEKGKV